MCGLSRQWSHSETCPLMAVDRFHCSAIVESALRIVLKHATLWNRYVTDLRQNGPSGLCLDYMIDKTIYPWFHRWTP